MNRLKVIRAERNLRQFTLAQESGINQAVISMIENEIANPTEEQKAKIARALKVRINQIWPVAEGEE